ALGIRVDSVGNFTDATEANSRLKDPHFAARVVKHAERSGDHALTRIEESEIGLERGRPRLEHVGRRALGAIGQLGHQVILDWQYADASNVDVFVVAGKPPRSDRDHAPLRTISQYFHRLMGAVPAELIHDRG